MQSDLSYLDKSVQPLVKRVIFNSLLLPYYGIATNNRPEQNYDKRGAHLLQYVDFSSRKYLHLDYSHVLPESMKSVLAVVKTELNEYEELLPFYSDTHSITRQILLSSIKSIIDKTIEIFPILGKQNSEIFEAIINFYLSVIKVLQIQLGSQFLIQIIKMFLETALCSHINVYSLCAMDKLLKMLLFIVQESASTSINLMPDILNLTIEHILPLVLRTETDQKNIVSTDIGVSLFSLFDCILQFRWNYFQKNLGNHQVSPIQEQQQDQLIKIFTAYGRILVTAAQYDPTVVRVILNSLERLNQTCKLYEKNFFKTHLLKSFLSTFIRLIVSPESTLFYDLLTIVLFNMSSVDKPNLHAAFIELGYPQDSKIIQQVCEATDSPTFCNFLDQIVQDTRFNQFLQ